MKYCDYCKCLSPKEREQSREKEPHMCNFYKVPLFHNGQHPRIPTPDYCNLSEEAEAERDSVGPDDYRDQERNSSWK